MEIQSTVLIIGASRGLGLLLAEQWCERGARKVIATVRQPSPQLDELARKFAGVLAVEQGVDIDDAQTVHALHKRLRGTRLDILLVNAGIARDNDRTAIDANDAEFLAMMRTNALAPARAVEILTDMVSAPGVIAVMSSGLGSVTNSSGAWPLYGASKAALNLLVKSFVAVNGDGGRAVVLINPGWIRTDMGGPDAEFEAGECLPAVLETLERSRGTPGVRFVDRFGEQIDW
jgi:NAD(P)-dependent dehydrogenase (short-subunit alcohol dehydrogenase family)